MQIDDLGSEKRSTTHRNRPRSADNFGRGDRQDDLHLAAAQSLQHPGRARRGASTNRSRGNAAPIALTIASAR